jgi:hypothetical protein
MPTCLLCGADGPVTEEHAPPKWTKDAFYKRHPELAGNPIRRERHGKDFAVPNFSDAARAPCDTCRVWWNKNFEHAVRRYVEPILFGEPVVVPASETETVATWIGYQSMIRAIPSQDVEFGEFPKEDFRFLRTKGRLPDDHVLWIGCRDEIAVIPSDPSIEAWNYTPHSPGAFSVVFNLVCRHHYGASNAHAARHEGEDAGALLRAWPPPSGDLEWPPRALLTGATIPKVRNDAAARG